MSAQRAKRRTRKAALTRRTSQVPSQTTGHIPNPVRISPLLPTRGPPTPGHPAPTLTLIQSSRIPGNLRAPGSLCLMYTSETGHRQRYAIPLGRAAILCRSSMTTALGPRRGPTTRGKALRCLHLSMPYGGSSLTSDGGPLKDYTRSIVD